jgi:hypothetical protein
VTIDRMSLISMTYLVCFKAVPRPCK